MMYPLGHTAFTIDWRLGGGADWDIYFGFGCGAFRRRLVPKAALPFALFGKSVVSQ